MDPKDKLMADLDDLEDEIAICETNLELDADDDVSASILDDLMCRRADIVWELSTLGIEV